ncbi:MAG: leucine-rich repeat protein, partial [Clostridia bacterium]|nr:leucine-rich repeat protein [Clostridia bacterium]
MKKIISFILCAIMLLSVVSYFPSVSFAAVYSGSCGASLKWSLDTATGVLSITGRGRMDDYDFAVYSPSLYGYVPPYGTSAPWGSHSDKIKSVVIAAGATSIGERAFSDCASLSYIKISSNIGVIGKDAFHGCTSLEAVNIDSVSVWCKNGFGRRFEVPYDIYFEGRLLSTLNVPEGIKTLTKYSFSGCRSLKNAVIPESVTAIGEEAFLNCTKLKSVSIPDSVTDIGARAFEGCSSLESVVIPDGVTQILPETFSWCTSLKSVTLPRSVKSLGSDAFSGCRSLEEIALPEDLESVGEDAFFGCSSLKFNRYEKADYLGSAQNPYFALVRAKNTGIASCRINDGAKIILDKAFYGCSYLITVDVPDSVVSLGDYSFGRCVQLETLTLGKGVKTIGYGAFSGCEALKNLSIPDGITDIGKEAFAKCRSLKYTAYDGVRYLGNADNPYAVIVKTSGPDLTACIIHYKTKFIYHSAFYSSPKLKRIFYYGTEEAWTSIIVGSSNTNMYNATLSFLQHTNHVWDSGVETPATYTADGQILYTCSSCGAVSVETIPRIISTVPGDVDGDGAFNLRDLDMLKRFIASTV